MKKQLNSVYRSGMREPLEEVFEVLDF